MSDYRDGTPKRAGSLVYRAAHTHTHDALGLELDKSICISDLDKGNQYKLVGVLEYYIKIFLPSSTFLEANTARSFQNAIYKCSRALNIYFFLLKNVFLINVVLFQPIGSNKCELKALKLS